MTIAELFYAKQAQRAKLWPLRGRRQLPRRRKVLLEPLEPRLLLSANPLTYAAASGVTLDLTLRLDESTATPILQLVDSSGSTPTVVAQQALADTSQVIVTGSAQGDKLVIDNTKPFSTPVSYTDTSSGDNAKLEVLGGDTTWNITGPDGGTVGNVTFAGIGNLIGAADNRDTFVLGPGGSVSGRIEGGAGGFDTLVNERELSAISAVFRRTGPDAGKMDLDGTPLVYAGLEPITTNAAQRRR